MRPSLSKIIAAYSVMLLSGGVSVMLPEPISIEQTASANQPEIQSDCRPSLKRTMPLSAPGFEAIVLIGD